MAQKIQELVQSNLESRIADLPPAKRALLQQRLKTKSLESLLKQTIPRRSTAQSASLSFAQQRLWFLDQYEPNSSFYNVSGAMRLRGGLNTGALEESLKEIIHRHESLRTTFTIMEGEPIQVISPSLHVPLSLVDLSDTAESEREQDALRLVREESRRPFDLVQGPLLRASVVRLSEQEHILVLTLHHIVSDGWSMGVLYRELSVLYEAYCAGKRSPLPDLPIQYADFAVWQREWLQGEVLESQLSYWKKQLEGAPAVLNLPMDYPRPAVQSYRGARRSIQLSRELSEGLKALSRKEGVTLFMTLLAAFQTLLYRYTGQEDVVVGSPIANRNRIEIEGLIGFFVNTLVLRTDLSGNPTFRELLRRVRRITLEAYEHQDLPFEKLVEELNPERSLSHSPLFQVMFILQNAPSTGWQSEGLSASPLRVRGETAKFDLTVSLSEQEDGILSSFEYATDLFEEATILRVMGHFSVLLEGIVANLHRRVSELPILTKAEEHQLLMVWNDTKRDYPKDNCVHELFEAQVERSPDAVAVVFEDDQLSYRGLNERANQVAHYLIKKGVGPDVLVPICMSRSVDMLVGILAILKAGGAYVPLDPSYPMERLALMLGEVGAPVLLTQAQQLENLSEHTAHVLCLDESQDIAGESRKNFVSGATRDNLAYVLYTSGSTGIPKGVTMSHGSLLNLLSWQLTHFAGAARARTLQFASLSFDVSFQEIFATWCCGGTLVLIAEELRRDAAGLLGHLKGKSVERLFLPFVALQQLAEAADSQESLPHTLREVITAGEQLQVTQPIVDLFSHLKNCQLQNQYGPTESHVVTAFALTGSAHTWPRLPPIGRPIANTEVYLLDANLAPVPIGVAGELHIGEDGLARGYLNRPELTAEKFVPHPFAKRQGARLYKTGDLARYLPDGNIEFLGRTDYQVKVRGFRIEPREIECVLSHHPNVQQAVVLARQDHPGDKRLVAYVVPAQESIPNINELRNFIKQKLPQYMIPSAFVLMESFPLTANGKIDRKGLPAPDHSRPEVESEFVAPRTPTEEFLAKTWAEVLKLEKVGIHDNFFELGGHSLLATRLVSQIRRVLDVDLPLRVIFEKPTIESLALHLLNQQAEASHPDQIDALLAELDSISDENAECQLFSLKQQPQIVRSDESPPVRPLARSRFHCPQVQSAFFGKRECNLIVLLNESFEMANFEKVAGIVGELDPTIHAVVVRDAAGINIALRQRPTMTFSPALIRHRLAQPGRVFCGYPLSKSEECTALAEAGVAVPKWVLLSEDEAPDLSGFAEYVVRKPNYGGRSAEVLVVRRDRVKWKPLTTRAAGTSASMIIQQFVYTGALPTSYRVNTLFGRVLYCTKYQASPEHPEIATPADLKSAVSQKGFTISASGRGNRTEPCFDEDIIELGERAHAAFPNIPLLGFDIVREVPSGNLYVLEANAIGYVWNFNSHQVADYGFSFEEQFDGVRKAAYILAEKTQQYAE